MHDLQMFANIDGQTDTNSAEGILNKVLCQVSPQSNITEELNHP